MKHHVLVGALSGLLFAMPMQSMADEPIELHTTSGSIKGSLLLPHGTQQVPVALIIAGSGPTDRNGNNPMAKNDSLKMLARALAEGGIASVRYDKRGVGESAGALTNEADVVFTDIVKDAAGWISKLADDTRFSRVIVIGHSEGSTIGMLAARQSSASAYVSIAGPSMKAAAGLRSQLKGRLPPALTAHNEAILVSLERGETVTDIPAPLMTLYRPSVQPYLIDWFKIDPAQEIKKLRVPCLILQGDTDIQIPVSAAQTLHAANPDALLAIIEGMNHILKSVPNEQAMQIASYSDPSLPLTPALSATLLQFIASHNPQAAKR
jgi:pimeloyl-ACP methyl ester carboxylesterase